MPTLENYFHYRNLDVSTLKELAARWSPELKFKKGSTHLALDDIRESIAELRTAAMLLMLYLIAITAEAMTGALSAGRRGMDWFGVVLI
nr:ribonuclease H-like protein [Tanacetum cinerariifolium]